MIKEMGIHQIRHDLIQSLQWKDFDQYSTFYKKNTNPHKYLPFAKKRKHIFFSSTINKIISIGVTEQVFNITFNQGLPVGLDNLCLDSHVQVLSDTKQSAKH